MRILSIVLGLVVSIHAGSEITHLCKGFAPKNNRSIPVAQGLMQIGGISEQEFHAMLDRIEGVMSQDVAERGATFKVNRLWESGEVNAYAHRDGSEWVIDMHGGLARHPLMTADGYIMVACHELGHHIGGAPHYSWHFSGMSNEGQSDYYATLKCFRRLFTLEENRAWAAKATIDPVAEKECSDRHGRNEAEVLSCKRAAMAGLVLGNVLAELGYEAPTMLGEYDHTVVARTVDAHPEAQCRLDTYFNGALCTKSVLEKNSDSDELAGSCDLMNGYDYGYRPRCWYAPKVSGPIQLELPMFTKN